MNDAGNAESGTDLAGETTDDEVLTVLEEATRSPLTTDEVATELGVSAEETSERLVALAEAGELERRELEHGTWWRLPGRAAEPSEEAIAAAEASGGLVATGVDPTEGEASPPAGAPPDPRENFWSGVEWRFDVEVDRRLLAALAFVGVLVLAARWRRR